MKITKRTKQISRTINLGGYNSIKIDNSAEALVEDGDVLEDVDNALYLEIRRAAANDIRKIKEDRRKVAEDTE
jgi:hypothetical protein